MSRKIFAGLVPAMLLCAAPAANAQMMMQGNVTAAQALTIVHRAIDACRDASISITVLDRDGNVRLQVRGNGANPHNLELSRRKAYTARTFRRSSLEWAKRSETTNQAQRNLAEVIALGGGVPINVGNETIGAVGVSGTSGGQEGDDTCAKNAIAKVADQLK